MIIHQVCFSSVMGNLHCQFFGKWLKTAFDYPHQLDGLTLDEWRKEQPLYGEIDQSHDIEWKA